MKTIKTLSWLVVVLGAWEVIAPFVLGYAAVVGALWDAIIVGAVLIVLAGWAALSNQGTTIKALEWIDVFVGAWLIVAPFIIPYTNVVAAMWNDILVGALAVVLSGWAALMVPGQQSGTSGHPAG